MADDVVIRPGTASDAPQAAGLILSTLGQFGERLFGFGNRDRAEGVLTQLFSLPGNRFSYQHASMGMSKSEIAGIMLAFTRMQMRLSMVITAMHMARVFRLHEIPTFLMNVVPYRSEERIFEDELYIAHLAVDGDHRRKGVGLRLLEQARLAAVQQGKAKLSLLTEVENAPARALYEKFGFRVTETIIPPAALRSEDSEGDVRMVMQIK